MPFYFSAFLVYLLQSTNTYGFSLVSYSNKIFTKRQSSVCANHSFGDFVQHPDDCKLFYLCVENGDAVEAACPPTMLFNAESKLCDMPNNVKCLNSSDNEEVPDIPVNSPNNEIVDAFRYCASLSQLENQNQITFVGSSNNCQRYYMCYYGQALLQECSANLHWNPNIGKCDLPQNANCRIGSNSVVQNEITVNNNQPNVVSNSNTNTATNDLINCPTYGQHIFPHMERCNSFIYCVKGHAIPQQCTFFNHFDVISKSCKWRTSALCVKDLNINFRYS
ncbi:probable chitinase 10 [Teleopsis dalmanni]|uniref:probable chitinase 10 n=1 Tax=Teleopsis dalmanni TaxID=139649 RepID=UPI0018CDB2C0|nr:probable chitinase 10 [Teleopsis dalmanni]